MESRFKALRFIGVLYKVLGVAVAALTIVAVLAALGSAVLGGAASLGLGSGFAGKSTVVMLVMAVAVDLFLLLWGGAIAVSLYAVGEAIYLFISIEENTRATLEYTKLLVPQKQ